MGAGDRGIGEAVGSGGPGLALAGYVKDLFKQFQGARRPWEAVWQECLYNYLGQYQQETVWKQETEGAGSRSRIFIKLTALKCNTAHAKIVDAMFAGKSDVPFGLWPLAPAPGAPMDELEAMGRRCRDRLREHFRFIELEELIDAAILDGMVFGTIILKGPIIEYRQTPRVSRRLIGGAPAEELAPGAGQYQTEWVSEPVAVVDLVPIWEYYTDPNAKTPAEAVGEMHFKRMQPARFRELARHPGYDGAAVRDAARRATAQDADDTRYIQLGDFYTGEAGAKDERVSVLEYWGLAPVEMLREAGAEVAGMTDQGGAVEALVVLAADGVVIKAAINPLPRRPFLVGPVKRRPHCLYGVGVAESMRDSQKMVNSAARLIIDNKALSGNGMVGVNPDRLDLKRTRNLKVYPGKTWYVKGNFRPDDAISAVSFPDITMGLRELMEMFERFSDEETGIPKYTHGEQGSFLNKTATGMSMLMTQANINLKSIMRNIDNYLIEPLVEAFHQWFAEMESDYAPGAAFRVKATGTDSLVAKEIKLEQLLKFLQITQNPHDATLVDRVKALKEISQIMEVNVLRSDEEIAQLTQQLAAQARAPRDMKEFVDLDRLYPLLSRNEQMQVLSLVGIEPDIGAQPVMAGAIPEVQSGVEAQAPVGAA